MKTQIIRSANSPYLNGQITAYLGDDETIIAILPHPTSPDHILLVVEKPPVDNSKER